MVTGEPVYSPLDHARAWAAAAAVCDPEIPILTIGDLGVLRDIHLLDDTVEAVITPTYFGCPAMSVIALDVALALERAGFAKAKVTTALSPAWTTDWLSLEGRAKLLAYGIAPPAASPGRAALFGHDEVACPRCASKNTERLSQFGSTACKAQWRCKQCLEPFDYFKCL